MCAVEESARISLNINTPRVSSIKKQGISYFDKCEIPANTTVSNTSIKKLEGYEKLTCSGIMHLQ